MIAELCHNVIESFSALNSNLRSVTEHMCVLDHDLPAWFQAPSTLPIPANSSIREQAAALINQVEYVDQQQPREILVGAGLVAASAETIAALHALNLAKNNFKTAMLKLRAAKISSSEEYLAQNFEQLLPQRNVHVAIKLSRMGLARLHLKQCYRKIPYFMLRPNKVTWTWANTRSIKKISVTEAEQMLLKHTLDEGIERQLKQLRSVNVNEKLAIVQDLAPHLRANIVLPDGNETKRLMVKGPVPIFYLIDENMTLPKFIPPGIKKGKNIDRVIRKDVKINPEPFLPAIRAHRYYSDLPA